MKFSTVGNNLALIPDTINDAIELGKILPFLLNKGIRAEFSSSESGERYLLIPMQQTIRINDG